ncbi:hypothetical protein HK097_008785, partial [Rhizophlyctis rosea]
MDDGIDDAGSFTPDVDLKATRFMISLCQQSLATTFPEKVAATWGACDLYLKMLSLDTSKESQQTLEIVKSLAGEMKAGMEDIAANGKLEALERGG